VLLRIDELRELARRRARLHGRIELEPGDALALVGQPREADAEASRHHQPHEGGDADHTQQHQRGAAQDDGRDQPELAKRGGCERVQLELAEPEPRD
jgi:hypothetical protein